MKVSVISRKLIKPSTPTPQNHNKYILSFLDEVSPPWDVSVLLFFPPNPKPKPILITQFEESLAKILSQFYPFAGRYIKKDDMIDCCDEGAEFVEAEAIEVEMMDFIAKSKNDQFLNNLLSRQPYEAGKPTDPLLSIQITDFKSCGGLAISISVSHKIADASSVGTFIAALSNIANTNILADQMSKIIITNNINPSFDSPMLFPGKINASNYFELPKNIVVKRLLFNKEAISRLRSKLISPNNGEGRFLSRVRVVSALITKALIGANRAKHGKSRSCFILQAVDMRNRTIPPLSKHSCGNLVNQSITETNEDMIIGLQELVNLIGDGIDKTITDCAKLLSLSEDERKNFLIDPMARSLKRLLSGEINYALWFSDWSKFGFYEADFGWGKPVWVSIGMTFPSQNLTLLMNNKEGDGIEAWVHLTHDDMHYFDQDEEINLFIL